MTALLHQQHDHDHTGKAVPCAEPSHPQELCMSSHKTPLRPRTIGQMTEWRVFIIKVDHAPLANWLKGLLKGSCITPCSTSSATAGFPHATACVCGDRVYALGHRARDNAKLKCCYPPATQSCRSAQYLASSGAQVLSKAAKQLLPLLTVNTGSAKEHMRRTASSPYLRSGIPMYEDSKQQRAHQLARWRRQQTRLTMQN